MSSAIVTCPSCGTRNRVPVSASGTPRCAKCKHALPWIVEATADEFDAAITGPVLVLVDFSATWCGPCKTVSPILEGLAIELAGNLKLLKVNVDESPRTAGRFNIQSIPTLSLWRSGKLDRRIGAAGRPALGSWLRTTLDASAA